MFNLRGRSFLKLLDFKPSEISFLLELAAGLKSAKYSGTEHKNLEGKNVVLVFQKASTRTRISFEVAVHDQGGHVTFMGPSGSHIGKKESIADTARVLGRVFDGIEYRGFGQDIVESLAKYAGVPVWNGLTNEYHPTQILADFLTMKEHVHKSLKDISFCYIGDANNNMGRSLAIGAAKMGMDLRLCAPKPLFLDSISIEEADKISTITGARILQTEDREEAVRGVDFIYTDVWVSMGEPDSVWAERIKLLKDYQVSSSLMKLSGNPYVKFMHCLPAFHNTETAVGEEICKKFGLKDMEVTEEVFESHSSIVFDQAENRMHTIKAIIVATIGN